MHHWVYIGSSHDALQPGAVPGSAVGLRGLKESPPKTEADRERERERGREGVVVTSFLVHRVTNDFKRRN